MNPFARNIDPRDETGFTIIELLAVILVIGILASIAIPAFLNQRKQSVDASVLSDVRNAATAVQQWSNKAGAGTEAIPSDEGAIAGVASSSGTVLSITGNSSSYCIEGRHSGGDRAIRGVRFSSDDGKTIEGNCSDFSPSDKSGKEGSVSIVPLGVSIPIDAEKVMTSIWNTAISGCSTITLPVSGTVNGTVTWGDGTEEPLTTNISHSYSDTPGNKDVTIKGTFTAWNGSVSPSQKCITAVTRWGETGTTNLGNAFLGASNLVKVDNIPSTVTSTANMFRNATTFNGNIAAWNVSKVSDMTGMFQGATKFNRPLGAWNVSNVVNMPNMFAAAYAFNQNLNTWKTSKVNRFSGMFDGAISYNQPMDKWDVSNSTNFAVMFRGAGKFNQPLKTWNISKATNISWMFDSTAFNQDISNWNTANVTDMGWMFANAKTFNQDISNWNTSKVANMRYTFMGALSFNQDISRWDTSKVTTMDSMFASAPAFDKNISGWNVSSVTTHTNFSSTLRQEYRPVGF